jgi:hypothetical protein
LHRRCLNHRNPTVTGRALTVRPVAFKFRNVTMRPSRSGSSAPLVTSTGPAEPSIVIARLNVNDLSVQWNGFDPIELGLQGSPDGVNDWTNATWAMPPGAIWTVDHRDGPFFRVCNADGNEDELPPYSNVVYMPGED